MDNFSIGEIAIYRPMLRLTQFISGPIQPEEEVEILSEIISGEYGPSHYCSNGDMGLKGNGWIIEVAHLRKRPPKEDARKWFDEKIKLNPKVLEEA